MSIYIDRENQCFYLESKDISYIFKNENGILKHIYYGKRIKKENLEFLDYKPIFHGVFLSDMTRGVPIESYGLELASLGHRGDFRSSSLEIDNRGYKTSDFKLFEYKILNKKPKIEGLPSTRDGQTLKITLKDTINNIMIDMFYTVYEDSSAITRRMEITNYGENIVKINKAYSMNLDFYPKEKMQVISFNGAWLQERIQERCDVTHNQIVISSNRGSSSSQANPSMALVEQSTTLNCGVAIGVNVIYSGDFAIKVQKDQYGKIRVQAGINEDSFEWILNPKETFSTPEVAFVYSAYGLNGMSREFHTLYREHLINPKWVRKSRDVVCNNWEATGMDFDEKRLELFIDNLKNTGVDTFVLDDGWFLGRNNDESSLGDWIVDKNKLPQGLENIINYTHKAGLKFGLWFEPEMISENSELYKKHPDWALHSNTIPSEGRNQFVLDLTREDVCDFIVNTLNYYLDNYKIDYIKWDMNRYLTEDYSIALQNRSFEIHHRYILGLYKIFDRVINMHSKVLFEGCSSGGARFDAGILAYFPQIWCSDNSDPVARAEIQANTSFFYPLSSIDCHYAKEISNITGRKTSCIARFAVASMGIFGTELDFSKLSEVEKRQLIEYIKLYKNVYRPLVLDGTSYILSEIKDNLYAQQIVSYDEASSVISVLQKINTAEAVEKRIYPKGLNPNFIYTVTTGVENNKIAEISGDTLMNCGINVSIWPNRFDNNAIGLTYADSSAQIIFLEVKSKRYKNK